MNKLKNPKNAEKEMKIKIYFIISKLISVFIKLYALKFKRGRADKEIYVNNI